MTGNRTFLSFMALVAAAAAAHADVSVSVRPLILAGDLYGGSTIVSGLAAAENFAVNDSGHWLIETNGNGGLGNLLISGAGETLPGTIIWQDGAPIASPAGATLSSFDSITLNNSGNSAFNVFYGNATTGTDSGVHFNLTQFIPEGTIATAPQFSANTPYIGWFEVAINNGNQILMLASIDDPAIASTVDRAIVRVDDPAGTPTQTALLKEGDTVVPGRLLVDVATGPHSWAFADNSWALVTPDLDGATTDDSGVLRYDGSAWAFVAREGEPSAAVPGRNWASLLGVPVDINSGGGWVARGTLNAPTTDDSLIVKSGVQVVAREGSPVAAMPAFTFTGFGTGAVKIDENGNVYFYGAWSNTDTTVNAGLFRNSQLIVQKGVTTLPSGETITDIAAGQDNFTVSDNGRYLIFEGDATDTVNSAVHHGSFLVTLNCPADVNNNGAVSVQDIFDFLGYYFTPSDPRGDFNQSGLPATVQDLFDFLSAYFAPCV